MPNLSVTDLNRQPDNVAAAQNGMYDINEPQSIM
jgi:hypothetical protein